MKKQTLLLFSRTLLFLIFVSSHATAAPSMKLILSNQYYLENWNKNASLPAERMDPIYAGKVSLGNLVHSSTMISEAVVIIEANLSQRMAPFEDNLIDLNQRLNSSSSSNHFLIDTLHSAPKGSGEFFSMRNSTSLIDALERILIEEQLIEKLSSNANVVKAKHLFILREGEIVGSVSFDKQSSASELLIEHAGPKTKAYIVYEDAGNSLSGSITKDFLEEIISPEELIKKILKFTQARLSIQSSLLKQSLFMYDFNLGNVLFNSENQPRMIDPEGLTSLKSPQNLPNSLGKSIFNANTMELYELADALEFMLETAIDTRFSDKETRERKKLELKTLLKSLAESKEYENVIKLHERLAAIKTNDIRYLQKEMNKAILELERLRSILSARACPKAL